MATDTRTPEVEAIVNIAGKEMNFIRLRISQEMSQHNDFEVLVDFKTFDQAFHESPETFMEMTNKKAVIDLQHADQPGKAYIFSGMVTNIRMIAENGMHGGVLFIGKSNTIELDRGEMLQTYSNTNLKEIFNTITGGTMNLSTENDPAWKADIDFAIQHRESDWLFLQRLCNQYLERVYYTGTDLVIGTHPEFSIVNLVYDRELKSFEICSRLVPNQFSTYFYKREEHSTLRQDSPASIENATNLLDIVSRRSDNLTISRKPNTPTAAYVPDMGSLIEHTKRRKVTEGAQMTYIKGEAKTCDVRIGRIVSVEMPVSMGGSYIGKYRVHSCVHEFDQNGRYTCRFEAIPADIQHIPIAKVQVPTPVPIECEIIQNTDPLGMGRVRVRFPFDERDCEAWIPTMTPSGGGNGQGLGPVNRGITMIPEISDSVLVSFLDGATLSQPVVIGSMFHANNSNKRGGEIKNNIKTIITRSKHMIKFDDTESKESITIIDKNENFIFIDTANNNITITANNNMTLNATETMTFNAKNLNINVGEHMTSQIGLNQDTNIGETRTVVCHNNIETVNKKSIVEVGKELNQTSGSLKMITTEGDFIGKGAGKTLLQGRIDARISKG